MKISALWKWQPTPLRLVLAGYALLIASIPILLLLVIAGLSQSALGRYVTAAMYGSSMLGLGAAVARSVWLICHKRRVAESISAICLAAPVLLLFYAALRLASDYAAAA